MMGKLWIAMATVAVVGAFQLAPAVCAQQSRTAYVGVGTFSETAVQQAYVYDGKALQTVDHTSDLTCDHWEMWFYTTDGERWGIYSGKSEDAVERDLREFQRLEGVDRKLGLPPPRLNWDSPKGPICVTADAFNSKPVAIQAIDRLGEISDRLDHVLSGFHGLLQDPFGPNDPYNWRQTAELDSAREYLRQIEDAQRRADSLWNVLSSDLTPSMQEITNGLDEAQRSLRKTEADAAKFQSLSGSAPRAATGAAANSERASVRMRTSASSPPKPEPHRAGSGAAQARKGPASGSRKGTPSGSGALPAR